MYYQNYQYDIDIYIYVDNHNRNFSCFGECMGISIEEQNIVQDRTQDQNQQQQQQVNQNVANQEVINQEQDQSNQESFSWLYVDFSISEQEEEITVVAHDAGRPQKGEGIDREYHIFFVNCNIEYDQQTENEKNKKTREQYIKEKFGEKFGIQLKFKNMISTESSKFTNCCKNIGDIMGVIKRNFQCLNIKFDTDINKQDLNIKKFICNTIKKINGSIKKNCVPLPKEWFCNLFNELITNKNYYFQDKKIIRKLINSLSNQNFEFLLPKYMGKQALQNNYLCQYYTDQKNIGVDGRLSENKNITGIVQEQIMCFENSLFDQQCLNYLKQKFMDEINEKSKQQFEIKKNIKKLQFYQLLYGVVVIENIKYYMAVDYTNIIKFLDLNIKKLVEYFDLDIKNFNDLKTFISAICICTEMTKQQQP